MKIYHYTHVENWHNISSSANRPGLRVSHRMGQEYIEAWETPVVNALLEPVPKSWEKSKHFKGYAIFFHQICLIFFLIVK